MNRVRPTASSPPAPLGKVVYFATGTPVEVAADLQRLGLGRNGTRLRVVVPAPLADQLERLASLKPEEVLPYRPRAALLLWLRLWGFLGVSSGAQIICLSAQQRFRFLKFLALTLRGQASFSSGSGTSVSCDIFKLLWFGLARSLAARGPICLVGSASRDSLDAILQSLRQRYPGVPVHGLLPHGFRSPVRDQFDSWSLVETAPPLAYFRLLPRCLGRKRFRRIVLPWSDEQPATLRWLVWFLPIWHVEIYNENLDVLSGRNLLSLSRHGLWRRRQRREYRQQQRERRCAERKLSYERWLQSLPVGVIGSASGYYLKKIVPALRSRYAGVPVHGILPAASLKPAEGLFDSVRVVEPGLLTAIREGFRLARLRKAYQCWIIPCTDEPYYFLKLMAFLWPLFRRQIYNELADGFAVRDLRSAGGHFRWRLRDHLSYQIVAGAAGKGVARRFLHLCLYGIRLLGAVPLLVGARLRSSWGRRRTQPARGGRKNARVDVVLLVSEEDSNDFWARHDWNGTVASLRRVTALPGEPPLPQVLAAIQTTEAEFVCVLDSRCEMSPPNWLEPLLEAFDDTVAQVGPQIRSPREMTFVRGALLGAQQNVQWNTDHATRWHSRPEWLEVDALPWVCVVIRRKALVEICPPVNGSARETEWVDVDFCRRLAERGWASLCNRNVTATHPMATAVVGVLSRV